MSTQIDLSYILDHLESVLYVSYALLFIVVVLLEAWIPRRPPQSSKGKRWFANLSIFVILTMMSRFLTPVVTANLAYFTWKKGWGILNIFPLSAWGNFILSLFFLDLMAYGSHYLYHRFSWTWRFHKVHHLDLDMDASTGLLFHPGEALLNFISQPIFILAVGPSPFAFLLFALLGPVVLLMTHANIRINPGLDRALRMIWITPDMHRVHHTMDWGESNSNFGFFLSLWDRFFGTYRMNSRFPSERAPLGLEKYREPRDQGIWRILITPFLKKRKGEGFQAN